MVKRILFFFVLMALQPLSLSAAEAYLAPKDLLSEVGTQVFDEIGRINKAGNADRTELAKIVDSRLMPYIDIKFVSYKLLGKHVKSVKREQAQDFIVAVRHYLGNTYAGALAKYKGQTVIFDDTSVPGDEKYTTVKAHIIEQGAPTIDIDFKLRRSKQGDWKVYDMVAEGISLLSAKQKEIVMRISEVGIDQVIRELQAG